MESLFDLMRRMGEEEEKGGKWKGISSLHDIVSSTWLMIYLPVICILGKEF